MIDSYDKFTLLFAIFIPTLYFLTAVCLIFIYFKYKRINQQYIELQNEGDIRDVEDGNNTEIPNNLEINQEEDN